MKGSFLFAQIPGTHFKTHTLTLISWTLLGSWKDTWSQDPGHLTLPVPDVTHYGCWWWHAFLPTPSHSGTGPSCELVGTGYITTMYTSAVHLYTVHSMPTQNQNADLGQIKKVKEKSNNNIFVWRIIINVWKFNLYMFTPSANCYAVLLYNKTRTSEF